MTSFVLYILATVISIQYVASVPPDPATAPAVEQQVDPSVITPIDTVTVPNEAPVTPVQEPVAQAAPVIPVCDGSQVIYATPPSQDTITGMPNGPGLDAITLSNDGINTFLSNKIGIASNMGQLVPDQLVPEAEIIRSGAINPLTNDLVLLYQEIDPMDPTMTEPNQRLIIIPGFKLNSLLVESPALSQTGSVGSVGAEAVAPGLEQQLPQAQRPGILAYELEQEIDLSEVEVGDQIPLTEIAFDCAGNLLGITLEGELVQMIIEAGNSNLEMDYIGRVQFQGPIVELSQGFVGLTYDFQTNAFVAVGGLMGKTLVQFQVAECTVFQIGNPIIITDNDNLCLQGIVSIAARGDNQYYVTCVDTAVGPMAMGLAVLELQGGTATILPLNAAQGQTLVPLPNSSGGAIIPSIPSTTGNSICFPRSIQSTPPTCNVLPADTDCQGDIQMQQVFPPPMGAPGASVNGGTGLVPPPGAQITVGAAPVNGQVGGITQPQLNGANGGYASGPGSYANGAQGAGTSFNGVVVPGTDTANAQAAANGVNGVNGEGSSGSSSSGSSASSASSGSGSGSTSDGDSQSGSASSDSDSDSDSTSSGSSGSGSDDDSSSGSGSDDSSDDDSDDSDDSTDESVSGSGNSASDDDSDNSGSDDSSDDNSDDSDDSSGSGSSSDDNNSGNDDDSATEDDDDDEDDQESGNDGGSTDSNSLDDSGDESEDDDNNASQSSSSSEERESGDDALSNGNDFHQNGFVSAQEYGSNGNGQMIRLSPSTLANLWGLAMIFLGINVTFLFVCYYRNGNCKKNQVTMDDDMDADIESL